MHNKRDNLTSRELMARIGLGDEAPRNLLDDEPLEELTGDLSAVLRERQCLLARRHHFAAGDLVVWKPGLKNRRVPRYGHPAVVVEVLETPVVDHELDAGSYSFREPLDLVLGVIPDWGEARGEMLCFHFDSRRFQPWNGGAQA